MNALINHLNTPLFLNILKKYLAVILITLLIGYLVEFMIPVLQAFWDTKDLLAENIQKQFILQTAPLCVGLIMNVVIIVIMRKDLKVVGVSSPQLLILTFLLREIGIFLFLLLVLYRGVMNANQVADDHLRK